MSELAVPLRTILPAFQGVIPSPVATVSREGVPNLTYVSVVRCLDEERVAISDQFLGKTTTNLANNPLMTVRVVDPETLLEYDLDTTWLRSERSGELFDSMRLQIDAIAAQTGMLGVFRLRAVQVLRVDACQLVAGSVGARPSATAAVDGIDALDVFTRRLDECADLDDLTRTALALLDELWGLRSSMLLMADDATRSLFVVAQHGSPGGAGAEIPIGAGVVGLAAERRRQVLVPQVTRALTLHRAAARSRPEEMHEIPLPGLPNAASLAATPILRRDRLLGVLYVDSEQGGRFGSSDGRLLEVIARHVGTCISLLDQGVEDVAPIDGRSTTRSSVGPCITLTFQERDGTVLLDGEYVIRGVAGRILVAMVREHQRSGRSRFSNRELRMNRSIGLPAGNDNLDARLLTLRRRLAERGDPIRLERVGRGQLEMRLDTTLEVVQTE